MRAALLPTPGNPAMLAYWLRNYATWREYVDELVVCINGSAEPETCREMVEAAGGLAIVERHSMGHDGALRSLQANTKAEHIVLCEDDAYVRKPKYVDWAFESIEIGHVDIIGSPRHEDYFGQFMDWGPFDPADQAEFRHGLWPAFLFLRRNDLQATDWRFGDQRWDVGEFVRGLERRVTPEDAAYVGIAPDYIHLDTLFGTTFQLRGAGLSVELVHHVRLYDAKATEEWINEDPPWFHVTGLSTLGDINRAELPDMDDRGGLWTRRVAWWLRCGVDVGDFIRRVNAADLDAWGRRFDAWEAAAVTA